MTEHLSPKPLLTRRQALKLIGIGAMSPFILSGCAVDPVTGKQQFMMMSQQQEIALDKEQSPFQFSSDYGPVQDRRLNAYINQTGRELATRSHRPDMPYSFRAVNAAYINAYAFPGGSVAATRGILLEMDNEAELAALLSHEIGHVSARHTSERATKGALAGLALAGASAAVGASKYSDYTDLVQGLGGLGAGALLAHYSRNDEREADALGMEYMTKTGYTPNGMVGLMEVLLKNGKHNPNAIELMFSTHPMSQERYQNALNGAQGKYRKMRSAPDNRDRYMDNTAGLRKIKGAITALQDGATAMQKKNYRQAEKEFAKALNIAPNDYAALVMMSKCKLTLDKSSDAERLSRKASKIYPQEAQAYSINGLVNILNMRYSKAYNQFSRYNEMLPGNPEATFYLGLSLEGMQRKKEAAKHYYQYLQQVRQGEKAKHAYNALKSWGYIK